MRKAYTRRSTKGQLHFVKATLKGGGKFASFGAKSVPLGAKPMSMLM